MATKKKIVIAPIPLVKPKYLDLNSIDISRLYDVPDIHLTDTLKEWYSNNQNVPIDANQEKINLLYNEDGTRKYQNGGTMKKKKYVDGGNITAADRDALIDYLEGSEHDLDINEIKRLEKLGYKLQY